MTSRRRSPKVTAARLAGVSVLFVGLVLAIVAPPISGFDETAHFLRAYEISEGRLIPHRGVPHEGVVSSHDAGFGSFPVQLNADLRRTGIDLLLPGRDRTAFISHLGDSEPYGPREATRIGAIAGYAPVPYGPAALGIRVGRLFGASTLQLLYLARFANLFAYVLLVVLAVRRCRPAQWFIAAVALVPVGIFGASTVTVDGITYGLCLLIVGMAIRLTSDRDRWRRPDTVLSAAAMLMLAFAKPPYALIGGVLLLAALRAVGVRRIALVASVGASWALMLVWSQIMERPLSAQDISFGTIVTNDQHHAYTNVDATKQLRNHVLGDPIGFAGVLGRTVRDFGFGWLRDSVTQLKIANVTPNALAIGVWLMLLLAALSARGSMSSVRQRFGFAVTALVISAATFVGAYVSWNAQGSPFIAAYQGRYLLVVAMLIASATIRGGEPVATKRFGLVAVFGMALSSLGYGVAVVAAFY